MKRKMTIAVVSIICWLGCPLLHAVEIDLSIESSKAIGEQLVYLKERANPLSLQEATEAFTRRGQAGSSPVLNFGIGSEAVWLKIPVVNPLSIAEDRVLMIATSWLDSIDVFFVKDGQTVQQYHAGDSQSYHQRSIDNRLFVFDHVFEPGSTSVFVRVETADPMVLPIFIRTPQAMQQREIAQGYYYGFVYGVLIALLTYNAILFFSLKNSRYLYYVIYLSAFSLMNLSYTGHAFAWLWPSSTGWQLWSNPVLMVGYSVSGLAFAVRFLNTGVHLPRVHSMVVGTNIGVVVLLCLFIVLGSQVLALYLAFIFIVLFSVAMLLLGGLSFYNGLKSAKYFLLATIVAMMGVALTALSVSGVIPYNMLTYHTVEMGVLIEVVLLALALADQFRITQQDKIQAERLSEIDPLTGINNRRGFYKVMEPILSTAIRNKRHLSLIMLDIDKFKLINDNYGHVCGDKVLEVIAKLLEKSARSGDIMARWGGEEFILLLPETDIKEAVFLADRLRESIATIRVQFQSKDIAFTASFGVACLPHPPQTFDELVAVADVYLYEAKNQGRDRVCFDSSV